MKSQDSSLMLGLLLSEPRSLDAGSSSSAIITQGKDGRPTVIIGQRSVGNYERWIKPLVDRVFAALLLILLSPVLGLVALLIRWDLGPGIIFKQQRVGRGGVPFTIYKFRTMHHDRRKRRSPFNGPERRKTHKTNRDPRHTPIGRFLRATSLDELPQLVNVLIGDMSIVGPRPELVHIVEERYDEWAHRRHDVKPGITGLWQVSQRDDEGKMYEHVALDVLYVAYISPWFDLLLVILTVPALCRIRQQFAFFPQQRGVNTLLSDYSRS